MGHSPLQPDEWHLHMLIYKYITRNNPLTSLFIIVAVAPFILLPTLYTKASIANFMTTLLFIVCYQLLYGYLSRKEALSKKL
jgi:NADH:ubiquinone oxidoreductase subunit 3 (subunit A)